MNRIIQAVSIKKAIIFTAISLLFFYLIDFSPIGVAGLLKVSNGTGILDFQTRYSVDFAYNWLEAMGEAGRNFHLTKVMPLDIFFPPSFMLAMVGWLCILLKNTAKENNPARFVLLLPVLYLILDWSENIGITMMLLNFPTRLNRICIATGILTSIKETVILLVIISFIMLLITLLIQKILRKNKCQG